VPLVVLKWNVQPWIADHHDNTTTRNSRANSIQRDFGLGTRSRPRFRGVATPVIGVDQREFHGIAEILPGRMQRIAVKKDRVA